MDAVDDEGGAAAENDDGESGAAEDDNEDDDGEAEGGDAKPLLDAPLEVKGKRQRCVLNNLPCLRPCSPQASTQSLALASLPC